MRTAAFTAMTMAAGLAIGFGSHESDAGNFIALSLVVVALAAVAGAMVQGDRQ